jgi:hypothetical protein
MPTLPLGSVGETQQPIDFTPKIKVTLVARRLTTEVRDKISASPGKGRAGSTISTAMAVERIRKMTDGIIEDVERAIDLQTALEAGK